MPKISVDIRDSLTFWEFTGKETDIKDLETTCGLTITTKIHKKEKVFNIFKQLEPSSEEKAAGWGGWKCYEKVEIGDYLIIHENFYQILKPRLFKRIFISNY